jgi:hypothetical protein
MASKTLGYRQKAISPRLVGVRAGTCGRMDAMIN